MRRKLKKENCQYKNYIIMTLWSTEVAISLCDRNYGFREKAIWQFSLCGISVSRYNKIKLVALAYSTTEMDLPIILSSAYLTKNLEEEYSKRFREFNILDPKNVEKELQVDDLTVWPKVNLRNIFEYILRMKEFDKEYMGKYKDQKAYSYFDSGFVGEILVSKINEGTKIA